MLGKQIVRENVTALPPISLFSMLTQISLRFTKVFLETLDLRHHNSVKSFRHLADSRFNILESVG